MKRKYEKVLYRPRDNSWKSHTEPRYFWFASNAIKWAKVLSKMTPGTLILDAVIDHSTNKLIWVEYPVADEWISLNG